MLASAAVRPLPAWLAATRRQRTVGPGGSTGWHDRAWRRHWRDGRALWAPPAHDRGGGGGRRRRPRLPRPPTLTHPSRAQVNPAGVGEGPVHRPLAGHPRLSRPYRRHGDSRDDLERPTPPHVPSVAEVAASACSVVGTRSEAMSSQATAAAVAERQLPPAWVLGPLPRLAHHATPTPKSHHRQHPLPQRHPVPFAAAAAVSSHTGVASCGPAHPTRIVTSERGRVEDCVQCHG